MTANRGQRTEGRIEGGKVRGWEGGRRQRTEDRRQKTEGIRNSECGMRKEKEKIRSEEFET
jgi:hypothetical protein